MKSFIHVKKQQLSFKAQDEATNLPYIYLSAGVSAKLFQETLVFAHESGANFNGVLCGRATWAGSVEAYIKDGEAAAREWLRTTGFENIDELNKVLQTTATSWTNAYKFPPNLRNMDLKKILKKLNVKVYKKTYLCYT